MIYAGILAGGIGRRFGNCSMPKQFNFLGDKPIIIHTIEKFLLNQKFDYIYVGVVKDWVDHTKELINQYIGQTNKIRVVEGGSDRNETIMNIIKYIEMHNSNGGIIVTHDAVRPFVTQRIINDNIKYAIEHGITNTVIPATDTIVNSSTGDIIYEIPDRALLYQGQTPQSFNINILKRCYESLTKAEKTSLTEATKICILQGYYAKVIMGEEFNIKITSEFDLIVAKAILESDVKHND